MGFTVFKIITTMPLKTTTRKLNTSLEVFSKYNTNTLN